MIVVSAPPRTGVHAPDPTVEDPDEYYSSGVVHVRRHPEVCKRPLWHRESAPGIHHTGEETRAIAFEHAEILNSGTYMRVEHDNVRIVDHRLGVEETKSVGFRHRPDRSPICCRRGHHEIVGRRQIEFDTERRLAGDVERGRVEGGVD